MVTKTEMIRNERKFWLLTRLYVLAMQEGMNQINNSRHGSKGLQLKWVISTIHGEIVIENSLGNS